MIHEEIWNGMGIEETTAPIERGGLHTVTGSVIAYFDGKPKGGTAYTCRKAREKRMPVVNVY